MSIYNLGRVLPIFRGEYDPTATYENLDVVLYNGSSYVALNTTTNNLPTDETHWAIVAQAGTLSPDQIASIEQQVIEYVQGQGYVIDSNYTHTDNNFTNADKNKLAGIDMTTKQDTLVSGTNIKTVNNQSLLGSGNITIEGGGSGTTNYNDLSNKPSINGTTLVGDTTITIPTKTSDLTNDSGFITTTQLNTKQDTLVSGTNIKTINNQSLLGSGNITIEGEPTANHFKGWFDSLNSLQTQYSSPVIGDYGYVKGATSSDSVKIYECNSNGTWSDSGREVDTSNVQSFESSESVNSVSIINNLTSGGEHDVLSAEMGKEIDESKINKIDKSTEEVWTEVDAVESYPKSSTYLNNNAIEGTLSGFTVLKCAVNAGDTYYITGSTGSGTGSTLAAFYDSEDSLISGSKIDSGVANASKTRYEVIAPSNAAYVRIQGYGSRPHCETKEIVETIVNNNQEKLYSIGELDELETTDKSSIVGAINENTGTINSVVETRVSSNLFDKTQVIDDKVVSTSGDLVTVSTWTYNKCTGLIPIEPNKYYRISGCNNGNGVNIRCLAANGSTKMKVLAPATGTEYNNYTMPNADGTSGSTRMNTQFLTPSNAAYVQFNIAAANTDSTNTTMLELVGDTYDPDFVPSEYEEYGTKYLIKESALPNIDYEAIEDAVENSNKAISRDFKVKVLLVGSSHGMNTISQFPWICYHSGLDVEVGNVYIGSFSLQRLVGMNERSETCTLKYFKDGEWVSYANKTFSQVFSFTDWDFISVQRSASDDKLWLATQNQADTVQNSFTDINYGVSGATPVYMSHNDALQYVLNLIKTNATKENCNIIFNTGFADADEGNGVNGNISQTTDITSTAKDMKEQFGIDFYPTAVAVRNARNTFLRYIGDFTGSSNANANNNLCYDSQHLDYGIGCYVPSMCLLEFISRKLGWDIELLNGYGSQSEVGTFISTALTHYTEPTEETMMVAKACAKCACNTPDAVSTKLQNRFKWKITYNLGTGITASNTKGYSSDTDKYTTTLSGTVNSVVITEGEWNRNTTPTTLTEGTDYTYDTTTQTLTIPSVEGDITITVS